MLAINRTESIPSRSYEDLPVHTHDSGSDARRIRANDRQAPKVFIRIYELTDPTIPVELECGNRQNIKSLAFSPDGTHLFAAVDHTVKVWNVQSEAAPQIAETPEQNSTLTYDRTGKLLATIHGSRIELRDAMTGVPQRSLHAKAEEIYDVAFDQQNETIVAACRPPGRAGAGETSGAVETWDVRSGAQKRTFESKSARRECFRVRFDPQGKFIAAGGWETTIWNLDTGDVVHQCEWQEEGYGWSAGIAFSPDGRKFAVGSMRGGIQMLDTRDWQVAWEHNPGFTFISLAFTPDGKYLVGCGYDYRIWFWDASTGEVIRTLAGPSDATDIAFSGDGSRFITGHNGVSVLWDMATGSQLLTLKIGKSTVKSGGVVTISPNGRQIATGGGKIIIW